jgi:PKD repeat protein
MKNYLFPVLFILSLFTFSAAKADHAMGSDITYKCTSTPGMFEITYTFYRSCTGIPVCSGGCGSACTRTLQLKGADPSCAASTYGSVILTLQSVSDVQDNICPSVKNICTNMGCVAPGSYTPAIEKYIFTGIVNIGVTSGIPASCCNVRVVFEECCRNAEINTGAAWENFYTDVVINRCMVTTPCNNGPKPVNDPLFVVAGGTNVQFSMAMFDAEGDSLTYSFVPSLQGFNSSVTYYPPWAFDKPLPWTGAWNSTFPAGISVGAQDGIVRFTPSSGSGSNFYCIFAVEAQEWKTISGVPTVVSKTRRDAECVILAGAPPNHSPRIKTEPAFSSSTPQAPKKDWIVCPGEQICFTILAKDTDITDTVKLTFSFPPKMAGATITPLSTPSTREDSVRFCWTPHDSVASNLPYAFITKVRDNFCPVDGKAHYNFTIKVIPKHIIDTISKTNSGCNKWNLGYSRLPGARAPYATQWRISKAPNDYSMTNVDVFTNVATISNRIFVDPGKYLVELTLTADSNAPSCADVKYDTIVVSNPQLSALLNDTSTCKFTTVTLQPVVLHNTGTTTYRWMNFGNSTIIGFLSTLPVSIGTIPKKIVLKLTDSLNCQVFDTITITPKATPVLSYNTPGGLSKCLNNNPFAFINTSVDTNITGAAYSWKMNDTIVSSNDTLVHSLLTTGNNIIRLLVTIPEGCSDSISKTIIVNPSPVAGITINNDSQCFKNNSFVFANASSINPPSTLTHQWNFGNGNTSAVTNPSAITYATAGTYAVRLVASATNGCRDTVIKSITIHPQPILNFTLNGASQCLNTNNFIATNTTPGSTDPHFHLHGKVNYQPEIAAHLPKHMLQPELRIFNLTWLLLKAAKTP